MIDRERLWKVMFDDVNGIVVKFRDRNYYIKDDEEKVILEYVEAVVDEASSGGAISEEDFILVVRIIETLNMCQDKFQSLLEEIYYLVACK